MPDRAISAARPSPPAHGSRATLPDEHAEPAETAMPSRSNAITAVSAEMPGTAKSVVLGSRSVSPPDDLRLRRNRQNLPLELGPQGRDPAHIGQMVDGMPRCNAKPDYGSHIFGAGAPAPLLPAARQKRARAATPRRRGQARRRPAGRRACAPTKRGNRRRARRYRPGCGRAPARRRRKHSRHAPSRGARPRRPGGSRRSRCWRASARDRATPSESSCCSSARSSAARSRQPERSTGSLRHCVGRKAPAGEHARMLGRADIEPAGTDMRRARKGFAASAPVPPPPSRRW